MAGADRRAGRLDRRRVGGDRGRVEHRADHVEADPAQEEGEQGGDRRGARQQAQCDETGGEQQRSGDGGEEPRRRRDQAGHEHAGGQGGDEEGALDRAVAPHLDRQQHTEEERRDQGREHQGEAGVGPHDVGAAGAPDPVQVRLVAQRPDVGLEGDERGGRRDRRLDEEDRPPVGELGEDTTERRPGRRADRGRGRPPSAGAALAGHHRREDGERSGEQQRGAEALHATGDEQHGQPWRRAGGQRGDREHDGAGQDEGTGAQPAVQQRHGDRDHRHGERVGRQHPGDADDGRVELGVQVGQGEGDDGGVGEGQRHRRDQQDRQHAAPDRRARHRRRWPR